MADAASTAASFGYSLAFFGQDPELQGLLDRATANNYTSERFVAELQNTNWFRTKSESWRKYSALVTTDPATYAEMQRKAQDKVTQMWVNLGGSAANMSEIPGLAGLVIATGMDDNQIENFIGARLGYEQGHFQFGQAAALEMQYRQTLADYGVSVDDATLGGWVRTGISNPHVADGTVKMYALKAAQSKYPALVDRLNAGETMKDIASPYIQSQAKLLEQNPNAVSMDDPLIQQALSYRDKDGKVTSKTIWQFEQDLRQDPRWRKTQNAQDSVMSAGRQVLSDFGLVA